MTIHNCAILLAVYNGRPYLEEQIASILKQQNVAVTIFTSVDTSTDGSELLLEALAATDPRIVLLPFGMRFGSASLNFFRLIKDVDFADFDYIAFADQDDCWHSDKLANAICAIKNTASAAYSSNVTAFWTDGRKRLINKSQAQKKWDFLFEGAGPGCTFVFTPKLLTAIKQHLIQSWDAHQKISFHDWYCYAFARAKGYPWFIDPKPSMLYRQHEKNVIGANKGIRAVWYA